MKTRSTFNRSAANCAKEFNVGFEVPRAKESGMRSHSDGVHEPRETVEPDGERCKVGGWFAGAGDPSLPCVSSVGACRK